MRSRFVATIHIACVVVLALVTFPSRAATLRTLHADDASYALAVSPDRRYLAVTGATVTLFDLARNKVVLHKAGPPGGYGAHAVFTDNNHLAIGGYEEDGEFGFLALLDIRTGQYRYFCKITDAGVSALVLLPSHRLVCAQTDDAASRGSVVIYDCNSLRRIRTVSRVPSYCMAYSSATNMLAIYGKKGFDLYSCHDYQRRYKVNPDQPDISFVFTHDGNTLVVVGKHISMFNASSGAKLYVSAQSANSCRACTIAASGSRVAFLAALKTPGTNMSDIGIFDAAHRTLSYRRTSARMREDDEPADVAFVPCTDVFMKLSYGGAVYRDHLADLVR